MGGRVVSVLHGWSARLSARGAAVTAASGGGLLFAAFPPIDAWPLAAIGPALLVVALAGRGVRAAFGLGALFGAAFFLPLVSWLVNVSLLAWIALVTAQTLVFAGLTMMLGLLLRLPLWPVFAAGWWVATEAVRSRFPLGGFPWGRLGFSQADSPLVLWASAGGVPLLSFVVALVGTTLAWLVLSPRHSRRPALISVVTATGGALAGAVLLPSGSGPESTSVAVVQGNVPRERSLEEQIRMREVTANHATATRALAEQVRSGDAPAPDLVIWPENSTDTDPRQEPEMAALIDGAARDIGRPILLGGLLEGPAGQVSNASALWLPGRGVTRSYAKRHLVPFGEYVPFKKYLGFIGQLELIARDITPGTEPVVFQTGKVRVGSAICYEIGYDAVVRDNIEAGANILVNQTNNATYMRDGQLGEPAQQLAMARVRAVEHNRSMLVSSTTGISAVIRPDGSFSTRTAPWRQSVLVERVELRSGRTLADRVGPLPELVISVITLLGLGVSLRGIRRRNVPAPMPAASPLEDVRNS